MALSQKGAGYANQAWVRQHRYELGQAMDDIASQVQAIAKQTNAPTSGSQATPPVPSALMVTAAAGFATAMVTNNQAPAGVNYTLQYSTSPSFSSPISVDLGTALTFHAYLHGLTLYFRVAARYATSALSGWTYFGTAAAPTSLAI